MTVFLEGIAAQFYRGIGAETQFIAPFVRMNFFIGANNAGKSTVLNLLKSHLENLISGKALSASGTDAYSGSATGQLAMGLGISAQKVSEEFGRVRGPWQFEPRFNRTTTLESELWAIGACLAIAGCVWIVPNPKAGPQLFVRVDTTNAEAWTKEWRNICQALSGVQQPSQSVEHYINPVLKHLSQKAFPTLIPSLPNIHLIPAKRELGPKGEGFNDLSGRGLIEHLAKLQNPDWDKRKSHEKFESINRFLQEVTGKPEAKLEVPFGLDHLLVHMDNKVLPLSSLGTGIHEVVLIAAFCTIHDGSIMCIEEPEIHLHPLLQRKLVDYLLKNTSSQYFIATHSSAFIDTPGASIFHVTNDGEQTRIKAVLNKEGQREILDDLGYHASDILQANAIIWVEGPSDRIYLNHWIKTADERLHEGIHYTIMFYGGGLIRHLTASDDALNEFIKLRDLNRNMAIVIDSDRETAESSLKPHAERLSEEMATGSGVAWVTAGREVENYIDGAKLQAALKQIHSKSYLEAGKTGRFDHAFYFWREDPQNPGHRKTFKEADKVGAANLVCQADADLNVLDLRERLKELTDMICNANGLSE